MIIRYITALALLLSLSSVSFGGTIILSGDSNIGDGFSLTTAGNQQFFQNVLGSGTSVLISNTSALPPFASAIDTFYNGLSGVSSSIAGPFSGANLAGVDLAIVHAPNTALGAGEIAALSAFESGGGTVFFIGENGFFATENGNINAALLALGSGMSIIPNSTFDNGTQTATGAQIASHALTTGVTSLEYASPSEIVVNGGTALFYGTGNQPFVAVESTAAVVPEPTSMVVWGVIGVVAVWRGARLRRKRESTP